MQYIKWLLLGRYTLELLLNVQRGDAAFFLMLR
jgi:hypothetical protein